MCIRHFNIFCCLISITCDLLPFFDILKYLLSICKNNFYTHWTGIFTIFCIHQQNTLISFHWPTIINCIKYKMLQKKILRITLNIKANLICYNHLFSKWIVWILIIPLRDGYVRFWINKMFITASRLVRIFSLDIIHCTALNVIFHQKIFRYLS